MSRIGKIARRTFLIGSAAVAGGAAFGAWHVGRPVPNPLRPGAGAEALNAYVVIDADGVTIVTPRAEMGQGVQTTLAALVAEELDIAWEDVRVMHGPASAAYANGAVIGEMLPGKRYDRSDLMHGLAGMLGRLGKVLELQTTGGSTSMRDGFVKMRLAGAAAREALKSAAAERLGVDAAALRTEAGRVIAPDGTALPYTDLAEAAARQELTEPALRDRSDWKYLGKPMPRLDMVAKSTGTAGFGIDVRLPGMKFAAARRNPARAGMASFDPAPALSMPGVEAVLDIGDGIAVVASNTWLAMRAAEAIEIAWEPAAYPATTGALIAAVEAAFDAEPNSTLRDDGDAGTVPAGATEISAEYRVPYLAHATMEPMNATVLFTGDAATVWTGGQGPTFVRNAVAAELGLDSAAVEVHTTLLGGGFGRRGEVDFAVVAARTARQMPGVPVQVVWSREEDMRQDFYRPAAIGRYRGAVQDGRAVLLDARIAAQSTTFQGAKRLTGRDLGGPDKGHVDAAFNAPYAIPNHRVAGHLAELAVPVGFWRSVGASFNGFFTESFVDELAHAAGRDPLDFRIEMARAEWEPAARVLEAVGEMSDWSRPRRAGTGRGVAMVYSFGTPTAIAVEVRDTGDGIALHKCWIACDVGTALDPSIIEAQMVSGAIYGFSAAIQQEITFDGGAVEQANFYDFDAMRIHAAPAFEVRVLEVQERLGGVGEPGTPPAAPALANALFDLTGRRARQLPLIRDFDLLI